MLVGLVTGGRRWGGGGGGGGGGREGWLAIATRQAEVRPPFSLSSLPSQLSVWLVNEPSPFILFTHISLSTHIYIYLHWWVIIYIYTWVGNYVSINLYMHKIPLVGNYVYLYLYININIGGQ